MTPRFFRSPAEWRSWLERNHDSHAEILVGFYKKHTGRASLTWSESVDQAICFGWIDGVRRSVDADRYTIRFTPRKPTSVWSHVNIEKVRVLGQAGLMHSRGQAAFDARLAARSRIYAYEQRAQARLSDAHERLFRGNAKAWSFFETQPRGYRHIATYWVVSAKKEETRARRLAHLIQVSGKKKRLDALTRKPK